MKSAIDAAGRRRYSNGSKGVLILGVRNIRGEMKTLAPGKGTGNCLLRKAGSEVSAA